MRRLGIAAVVALALLGGCDLATESEPAGPAPQVVMARAVAAGMDGERREVRLEAEGSTRIPPNAALTLTFDRYMLPSTVIRQSVCLQPLTDVVQSYEDCAAAVFLEPRYEPTRREVSLALKSGQLAKNTTYRLTIFVPTDDGITVGFRAFDGAALAANVSFELRTTDEDGPASSTAPPEPSDLACALLAGCASCHAGGSAPMGLDLSSAEAARRTAVGRAAHATQLGEHASVAETSPARFGRAMPIIAAGSAANSYLIYKLLIAEPDGSLGEGIAEGERERLRAAFVPGLPMPPPERAGLTGAEITRFGRWIDAGAIYPSCGAR